MCSEWSIEENAFRTASRFGREALFTLGNGYLGCRGFFEEEQEGMGALGGVYMAGVFGAGALRAWRGMHRELVNTPNFFWISIKVNDEQVLVRPSRISRYYRVLNMRAGILKRSFVWRGSTGMKIAFEFERFISVADLHAAGQRIRIKPLNGSPRVEIVCGIDANVLQHNMVTATPPVQPGRRHLETLRHNASMIEARVGRLSNGVRIAEGQSVVMHSPAVKIKGRSATAPGRAARRYTFIGEKGIAVELKKTVFFYTSRDGCAKELLRKRMSGRLDYDSLLAAHVRAWTSRWHTADVVIDGPADDQRALRFNIFQLIQACPAHDSRVSLGARGLTGEMHEGSVFWDNEIFKMPFFIFTNPDAARSMLRFRYGTLPEARRHAADLWFSGAMYAWKSGMDGAEETEMGVGAYYAVHIVADIAYALRRYLEVTGDDGFLVRYGAEIMIETARFWKSRCSWDPVRKAFNILAVRGPNEYDVIVNNNCYTNMMARENIRYALEAVARMKRIARPAWEKMAARLQVRPAELKAWAKCMRGIVIPYDKTRDLYAEDDMYLRREQFDMKRGKPDARRVIDHALPYEAMAFYQITKQSDVVTLMNLLPWNFSGAQKNIAFKFYEPRTVHDSSLSYAPHAVMAARLGRLAEAYRYFRKSAFLDMEDTQLNTVSGLHLANLGGTWQAVIQGFAGLENVSGRLCLDPRLPRAWRKMSFRVRYKKALLRFTLSSRGSAATLEKEGKRAVILQMNGKTFSLSRAGQSVRH